MARKKKDVDYKIILLGLAAFIIAMLGTLSASGSFDITGAAVQQSGRVNATVSSTTAISLIINKTHF